MRVHLALTAVVAAGLHLLPFAHAAVGGTVNAGNDTDIVWQHIRDSANQTFKEPAGVLRFPYLVPAGVYMQLWDWDSMFTGLGLLEFGSAPYFAGSMLNFLDWTNETDGTLPGCLTPQGPSPTLSHAKPIIIQGALLAAQATGNVTQFLPFLPKMKALLGFWDRERLDPASGLYQWHDQLETGADNLVTSQCPSSYSPECWSPTDINSLSGADIMTFLYRERYAYNVFVNAAREVAGLQAHSMSTAGVEEIADVLQNKLWNDTLGLYTAYNTTSQQQITNRVYQMGFPVWAGLPNATQTALILSNLQEGDMWTPFGIRSTSSADPRYSNVNEIDPYSNWRGPIWIVANVCLSYGLNAYGYQAEAVAIANNVVAILAQDLNVTGTWHECYDAETGAGLAAPGFLSWTTLAATWQANLAQGKNPFLLPPSLPVR